MDPFAAASGTSSSAIGPAVLIILTVIGIWWVSTHGRGEIKLRLLAWLLLPLIAWAMIAARSPAEGARIAGTTASGVSVAISSIGQFITGI